MAHISGGGLVENIPRILPGNCAVELKKGSWPVLPIFTTLKKIGKISESEIFSINLFDICETWIFPR